MKRKKKTILGYFGLAFVVAMTAYATTIPNCDVSAISDSVTVTVTVERPTVNVTINSPQDSTATATPTVTVNYHYSQSVSNELKLKYVTTGATQSRTITPSSDTGDDTQIFNLASASDYGDYVLSVKATDANTLTAEDSVLFEYLPTIITTTTADDETDDPIITLETSDDVCYMMVQAYLKPSMTPIFNPELTLPLSSLTDHSVTLPFGENNAVSGEYSIEILSYSCTTSDDPVYEPYYVDLSYTAPSYPDTPKTGALFESLNISKTDYLLSGAIIFIGSLIAFRIFIKKRSRR